MVGKYFEPTEKAKLAVKILPEEIIYPDTTAIWEKNLEEVANGKENFDEFYQSQVRDLNKLLEQAKKVKIIFSKNAVKCPNCGKIMVRRKGKNGYFWGCNDLLANGRNLEKII